MNKKNFIKILQQPDNLSEKELSFLEEINHEFPYFQTSKAIYLKSLKENEDIKFKNFLRIFKIFVSSDLSETEIRARLIFFKFIFFQSTSLFLLLHSK